MAIGTSVGVRWQDFFTDPRLRSLIDLALANNRDLRVAGLNIEKAAALYRIQRAEMNPTIGVQATGSRYRVPESMGDNARPARSRATPSTWASPRGSSTSSGGSGA